MFFLSDDTERQPMEKKGIPTSISTIKDTHSYNTHTHTYIHVCVLMYECIFISVYTVTHINTYLSSSQVYIKMKCSSS